MLTENEAGSGKSGSGPADSLHWPSVIRHYRLSAGMNQAQLADEVAVTQTMVSRFEAGTTTPSARIKERLFDLFWSMSSTVSRDVWMKRLARQPSDVAVIDSSGIFVQVSLGMTRTFALPREAFVGHQIRDLFSQGWQGLLEAFRTDGFFEGRLASAESSDCVSWVDAEGQSHTRFMHGLHRPVFMPDYSILWMMSGAVVPEQTALEVKERLGGGLVVRKAI